MSDKWRVVKIYEDGNGKAHLMDTDGNVTEIYLNSSTNPIVAVITRNDIREACESYCKNCDELVVADISQDIDKDLIMEYLREVVNGIIDFNVRTGFYKVDDKTDTLTFALGIKEV